MDTNLEPITVEKNCNLCNNKDLCLKCPNHSKYLRKELEKFFQLIEAIKNKSKSRPVLD